MVGPWFRQPSLPPQTSTILYHTIPYHAILHLAISYTGLTTETKASLMRPKHGIDSAHPCCQLRGRLHRLRSWNLMDIFPCEYFVYNY